MKENMSISRTNLLNTLHQIGYLVSDTLNINNPMKVSNIKCKLEH